MIIVADISGNHGGHLDKALELIVTAARCGCDYAKFQYYRPGDMYATSKEETDLYFQLHVSHDWLVPMFDCANTNNIGLFASIFSVECVQELIPFDPDYWKLASPQSTWLPESVLLGIVAAIPNPKDIIISADRRDLDRMHKIAPKARALYCPPGHPPDITDMDFEEIGEYYGFSDHTPDLITPLAFAAAKVQMIEKHLKVDDNCVDAEFSADASTMRELCRRLK